MPARAHVPASACERLVVMRMGGWVGGWVGVARARARARTHTHTHTHEGSLFTTVCTGVGVRIIRAG